jgi:hypothetical protein
MNTFFIGFSTLEEFLSNLAAKAEVYLFSHPEVKPGTNAHSEKVENFITLAEVRDGGRCYYWQTMSGSVPFSGAISSFDSHRGHARTSVFKTDIRRDLEALGKDLRILNAQVAFPSDHQFVRGTAKTYRLDKQSDLFVKIEAATEKAVNSLQEPPML